MVLENFYQAPKQEELTHNDEKNQSIETNAKMVQLT